MDITTFFKKKTDDNFINLKQNSKSELQNRFQLLIGNFVKDEVIDLLEYAQLQSFLKSGGTIVAMGRFDQIKNKIDDSEKLTSKTKQEFDLTCRSLFEHLYKIINNKTVNIDALITGLREHNQNSIEFTKDQIEGCKSLFEFLYDNNQMTYGLYGYAGTGKTTTITKIVHYMLQKNYVKSVAFCAPTNKAVNIMKSKFRNDIDLLLKSKLSNNDEICLMEQLERLEQSGYKISFLTIHKLLNCEIDYNVSGERTFTIGGKSLINNYDLVIVDECSMNPFSIVAHIHNDIKNHEVSLGRDRTAKKMPKVMFVGDPAQLPPVNENVSIVFAKSEKDFSFDIYKSVFKESYSETEIKRKFEEFKKAVLNQKCTTLQQVVRSNDDKVVGLCNETRKWVIGVIDKPKVGMFTSNKVKFYKYKGENKTETEWFKTCMKYFKNRENYVSTIILTWTNKQCDDYNNAVRKQLYKKDKLNQFEVGDILILNDFYNVKESEVKDKKDHQKRFYTSEQIKVVGLDEVIKVVPEFSLQLPQHLEKMKDYAYLDDKYKKVITTINKNTIRKYEVWKLYVEKLTEATDDKKDNIFQIYVIKDISKNQLDNDKTESVTKIHELRKVLKQFFRTNSDRIDEEVIRPLWREWNHRFIEPFADLNHGSSITVHVSQASTYYNVFVDAHDILKNRRNDEGKRCMYTAITRTSNEVHILI